MLFFKRNQHGKTGNQRKIYALFRKTKNKNDNKSGNRCKRLSHWTATKVKPAVTATPVKENFYHS